MLRNATAAILMVLGIAVSTAAAAEPAPAPVANAAAAATADLALDTDWSLPAVHVGAAAEKRGAVLPTLYVSLAALNAFDVMSTRKGLASGAVEANPTMQAVVGNTTSMIAVKAVATAGTVLAAEKLWKNHHKGQAIAVMLISNGVMSAVAMHNNNVLHTVGR